MAHSASAGSSLCVREDVAPHVAVSMRSVASGFISVAHAGTSAPQAVAQRLRCRRSGPPGGSAHRLVCWL